MSVVTSALINVNFFFKKKKKKKNFLARRCKDVHIYKAQVSLLFVIFYIRFGVEVEEEYAERTHVARL